MAAALARHGTCTVSLTPAGQGRPAGMNAAQLLAVLIKLKGTKKGEEVVCWICREEGWVEMMGIWEIYT